MFGYFHNFPFLDILSILTELVGNTPDILPKPAGLWVFVSFPKRVSVLKHTLETKRILITPQVSAEYQAYSWRLHNCSWGSKEISTNKLLFPRHLQNNCYYGQNGKIASGKCRKLQMLFPLLCTKSFDDDCNPGKVYWSVVGANITRTI